MKTVANVMAGLIVAAWMVVIATCSIQNIQPVSLKLLVFESAQMPVGVLLTFCVAVGVLFGAIAPLFGPKRLQSRSRGPGPARETEPDIDDIFNDAPYDDPDPRRTDWDERVSKTW